MDNSAFIQSLKCDQIVCVDLADKPCPEKQDASLNKKFFTVQTNPTPKNHSCENYAVFAISMYTHYCLSLEGVSCDLGTLEPYLLELHQRNMNGNDVAIISYKNRDKIHKNKLHRQNYNGNNNNNNNNNNDNNDNFEFDILYLHLTADILHCIQMVSIASHESALGVIISAVPYCWKSTVVNAIIISSFVESKPLLSYNLDAYRHAVIENHNNQPLVVQYQQKEREFNQCYKNSLSDHNLNNRNNHNNNNDHKNDCVIHKNMNVISVDQVYSSIIGKFEIFSMEIDSDSNGLNTMKVAETPINSCGVLSVAIGFRSFDGDTDSLEVHVSKDIDHGDDADDDTNRILISMSEDGNNQPQYCFFF